ncbi:MAG: proton-conducting transporter membrane subunit [Thermaerobacter sp.]|nr:proton-conducting transporter membrane subunit [Thermaerobacter sp.]
MSTIAAATFSHELGLAGIVLSVALGLLAAWRAAAGGRIGAIVLVFIAVAFAWSAYATSNWSDAYQALVGLLGAVAFWVSPSYLVGAMKEPWPANRQAAYFTLLGIFTASLFALGEPWSLIALWVAVEATTLSSVALVALTPGAHPFEAAWKYLMLAGMGGLIALAGVILVSGGSPGGAAVGAVMLLVGFGAKAGLVPLHAWLPDAHSQAPAPVSALLSGAELAGILWVLHTGLQRVGLLLHGAAWPADLLIALGLLSLAVGVGAMAGQRNLKRLLAYSSVEHMGVIALGMGFGGIALLGALLHVITHGIAKAQCFYVAGTIQTRYGTVDEEKIGQLHVGMPWGSGGLMLGLAALAGVPPFGPFFSEWLVASGGLARSTTAPAAVVMLALLALGFIAIAYRAPRLWYQPAGSARLSPEGAVEAVPAVVLSVLLLLSGFAVPWMLHWPMPH